MNLWLVLAGVVAVVGGLGLYWWVRRPPQGGEYVSAEWRDEHSRERRE